MPKTIVTGVMEIDRKLAGLPLRVQKKLARQALRKAGKAIQWKAKHNIVENETIDSGAMLKGIKVRALTRSRSAIGILVGTTEKDDFGGSYIELGTKQVRKKSFLRPAGYESEPAIRRMVEHDVLESLSELVL